jgi:hypothetical protein
MASYRQVGYLCIQKYPNRICSGCTTGCFERVFIDDDNEPIDEESTRETQQAGCDMGRTGTARDALHGQQSPQEEA